MDFETAFKKPFTDVKKLLIGILLSIVPIINFFAMGYMLECAKRAMKKDDALPEWDTWGDYFVKGLLSIVIEGIYLIPAIIIGAIFMWPSLKSAMPMMMAGQVPDFAGMMAGSAMAGIGVSALLALLAVFIAPSAIMHFLNGKFRDAFSLGSVFRKAFTGKYLLAWLIFIVYSIALGLLLGFVPYAGNAISSFIAGVTGLSLIGAAFGEIGMPAEKPKAAPRKEVKKRK
ncbi:MAG: DUF4013 domain-containing protein [Nanoarchaeota archaeon]|nr:DUF4013 domain-containing protein [Nanoarchaeota archaeon]